MLLVYGSLLELVRDPLLELLELLPSPIISLSQYQHFTAQSNSHARSAAKTTARMVPKRLMVPPESSRRHAAI